MNSFPSWAGQVGDRLNSSLAPQIGVWERRDVGHVNAPTHYPATSIQILQRLRNQLTVRGKNQSRIQLLGRRFIGPTGPRGTQFACKILSRGIARTRKRVDLAILSGCDLGNDVSR